MPLSRCSKVNHIKRRQPRRTTIVSPSPSAVPSYTDSEVERDSDGISSFSGREEGSPSPSRTITSLTGRASPSESFSHQSGKAPGSLNSTIQRWSSAKLGSTGDASTRQLISSLANLTKSSTQGPSLRPAVALAIQESNCGMCKSSAKPTQAHVKGKGKSLVLSAAQKRDKEMEPVSMKLIFTY